MNTPSVSRRELMEFLDGLIEPSGVDYCPNGLQIEGEGRIRKIVTGVSACRELLEAALRLEAQAVLVHHGLFWRGDDRRLVGIQRRRVGLAIEGGLNLIAYHLPLDRHAEIGNNVLAARAFGIESPRPFGEADELPIGWAGDLSEPLPRDRFAARCLEIFGQPPLAFACGPDPIRSAAFVSGAAERLFHRAIEEGYDAFVTGEVSEWVMNVAREAERNFFAAGHYATERLGIRALGDRVAERFALPVEFVDVPNPV